MKKKDVKQDNVVLFQPLNDPGILRAFIVTIFCIAGFFIGMTFVNKCSVGIKGLENSMPFIIALLCPLLVVGARSNLLGIVIGVVFLVVVTACAVVYTVIH